jgi:hypothetical protein
MLKGNTHPLTPLWSMKTARGQRRFADTEGQITPRKCTGHLDFQKSGRFVVGLKLWLKF